MAKKALSLTNPIKVITGGTVPTTANLKKGEFAYGTISGKVRYFGNVTGSAIVELTPVNAVAGVSYNSSTAVLTISYTDGSTSTTINLPKENFLASASYDGTTNKLTLTLTEGDPFEIDLSDLIDVYAAKSGGGLEVTDGNKFGVAAGGITETMLATAVANKLNEALSISGGTAETGKYISQITVSGSTVTVTKASLPTAPANYSITAAASQTISIGGTTAAATATINSAAAKTDGGLKVTSGALELDTDNIEVSWTVSEI